MLSGKYKPGQEPEDGTRFTLGTAANRYQAQYWHDAQNQAVETLKAVVESKGFGMVSVPVAATVA